MNTEQQQLAALDEDLKTLRAEYDQAIRAFVDVADGARAQQVEALNRFHAAGLAFFNGHERAIPLDARLNMDLNPTCYTERAETSANVLETIGNHYQTLRQWAGDLGIDLVTLRPSLTAFSNMQRRVQNSQPDLAAALRERFVELELPTRGFDTGEVKSSREAPPAPHTTNIYGPATGCAIGDGARVNASSINYNHTGDQVMSDKISITGDVTGSAVGSHAQVKARDITAYKQVVTQSVGDADLRQKLIEARDLLETLGLSPDDKNDAADHLGKLTEELQKPKPEPGRVQRFFNYLKDIAAPVASVLQSAVAIGKLLSGTP